MGGTSPFGGNSGDSGVYTPHPIQSRRCWLAVGVLWSAQRVARCLVLGRVSDALPRAGCERFAVGACWCGHIHLRGAPRRIRGRGMLYRCRRDACAVWGCVVAAGAGQPASSCSESAAADAGWTCAAAHGNPDQLHRLRHYHRWRRCRRDLLCVAPGEGRGCGWLLNLHFRGGHPPGRSHLFNPWSGTQFRPASPAWWDVRRSLAPAQTALLSPGLQQFVRFCHPLAPPSPMIRARSATLSSTWAATARSTPFHPAPST